jgi:hypothetical protein
MVRVHHMGRKARTAVGAWLAPEISEKLERDTLTAKNPRDLLSSMGAVIRHVERPLIARWPHILS